MVKLNPKKGGRKFDPKITDWVKEQEGKHICQCGCETPIIVKRSHYKNGVSKCIRGHNILKYNTSKWVEENHGKHICKCGCGGLILIQSWHRSKGIPKYIHGHKGKIVSVDTRLKLSTTSKGRGKGRHLSEKTKSKMSNSHIGIYPSQETKNKISQTKKGVVGENV